MLELVKEEVGEGVWVAMFPATVPPLLGALKLKEFDYCF
jgi:hypothetical protein